MTDWVLILGRHLKTIIAPLLALFENFLGTPLLSGLNEEVCKKTKKGFCVVSDLYLIGDSVERGRETSHKLV